MLPNTGMSFTPFDPLPASDLNDLVENIESLSDGTGIINSAILTRHIAASQVTLAKMDLTTFPSVTAYKVAAQNSTNGVSLIILDGEDHDQGSNFNTSTGLFTVPATGKYLITFAVYLITSTGRNTVVIYKNGSPFIEPGTFSGSFISGPGAIVLSLTAADTVGLGTRADGAYAIANKWIGTDIGTHMSIVRVA